MAENIALYGADPIKTTPFNKGNRFGGEELQELKEALEQNNVYKLLRLSR